MSDRRYGTMRWRRRARAQLEREPRCQPCLAAGKIRAATIADHVQPWRLAADPDAAFWGGSLQSCCDQCHQSKRQAERHGKAWKPKLGASVTGQPLDPMHPWNR